MKYYILAFFISTACFSQVPDIAKDTLQLEQVVIKRNDKQKIKKLKLEGICSYPEDMKDAAEIITLVQDVPKGKLGTVTFFFNKTDPQTYRQNIQYFKEADFEVVIYDVNDDGMPGIPSSIDQKFIGVDKAHQGRITVDFSLFNIKTEKKMFIGLRKLSEDSESKSFLLDCLCNGQDRYITYYRKDASSLWQRRWSCAAIKMEVSVLTAK